MSVAEPSGQDANSASALVLLSFAAGSMDAIAFLALGEVLTSAMSGNTIIFGLALAQGHASAAWRGATAFAGYVLAIACAAPPLRQLPRGVRLVLTAELVALAGFAALWSLARQDDATLPLILLSAIAMGLQGAVARRLRVPGITTVVFTSTLTAIVGTLAERLVAGERPLLPDASRRQVATYLAYFGSAATVGLLAAWTAALPVLPLAALLAVVIGLWLDRLQLD